MLEKMCFSVYHFIFSPLPFFFLLLGLCDSFFSSHLTILTLSPFVFTRSCLIPPASVCFLFPSCRNVFAPNSPSFSSYRLCCVFNFLNLSTFIFLSPFSLSLPTPCCSPSVLCLLGTSPPEWSASNMSIICQFCHFLPP